MQSLDTRVDVELTQLCEAATEGGGSQALVERTTCHK